MRVLPPEEIWSRNLRKLYDHDSVDGPTLVARYIKGLALHLPPGRDRCKMLEQMDLALDDAHTMKRIRKGWSKYEMTPWEVVYSPSFPPQVARYNSCPEINV